MNVETGEADVCGCTRITEQDWGYESERFADPIDQVEGLVPLLGTIGAP